MSTDRAQKRAAAHVFTYATHMTQGVREWENSAHRNGWEPVILGRGERWLGWSARAFALSSHISTLPANETVLVTDGFDVLILQSPEIFNALLGDRRVLLGTEVCFKMLKARGGVEGALRGRKYNYGVSHRLEKIAPGRTINGGCFAGKAGDLSVALRGVSESRYSDDQAAWAALADGEENCPGLAPDDYTFDVKNELARNLAIGLPELTSYAFAPSAYVRREVAICKASNTICLHVPGTKIDAGIRYTIVLKELGIRSGVGCAPALLTSASCAAVVLAIAMVLWLVGRCFISFRRQRFVRFDKKSYEA